MTNDDDIDKRLLTLKVIWLAMLVSLAIYLFVGLKVAGNIQISLNEDTFAVVKYVFYGLAFVTLIITKFIWKIVLSVGVQPGPETQIYRTLVLQRYVIAMIIAWALSEGIGIYGLVLFSLGKNTTDLYLFILISAAAMLMYRPRKDEVIRLAECSTTGGPVA
jgi:hypothetical protein